MCIGRLRSLMVKEKQIQCGMGSEGLCCCMITLPCILFGPLPLHPIMSILSILWRSEIVSKYDVDDGNCGCCLAVMYPCSMFQMAVSLAEWEDDERTKLSITRTDVYVPPEPTTYRVPLPHNALPGSSIVVELPGGRRVSVQVPPNTKPGQMLEITV